MFFLQSSLTLEKTQLKNFLKAVRLLTGLDYGMNA